MRRLPVVLVLITLSAAAAELGWLPPYSTADYCGPYVKVKSYRVPKDFVDGQWHGIIAASDGKTYFSVSSHSPDHSGQFYRFDPAKGKVEHLIDVAAWCGEAESIGKWNAQGKIHSQIFEADGKLYCSTTPAHMKLDHPYRGGHFLSWNLATGKVEDLGCFPDSQGGLLTMLYEPVRKRLYAISQGRQTLCYLDLATREIVRVGPCQDDPMQCRTLISDEHGIVYGCEWGHRIWRYLPGEQRLETLPALLPHDPEAPQPKLNPEVRDWQVTCWKGMAWDPVTRWWYGVKGNDEYLFRLRLPAPGSNEATVEGLTQFGYRPSKVQPRFASLALVRRDRQLFYVSYPVWRPLAHLMRYDIDTGEVRDLGPLVTDGGRQVSEIHSMVLGADGRLHAVAMVWSLPNSKDPAQPWANRASCFFHARLLAIDPNRDPQPANLLAAAPKLKPKRLEYAPGRELQVFLPAKHDQPAPAILLIHGGGWGAGSPGLLEPHARHYAGLGMVAATVQYRLTSQQGVRVEDCLADVRASLAYLREHAGELGLDPRRIAVAGDSAGGHLAACLGVIVPPTERADAMILWNPVIDTAPPDGWKMKGYTDAERVALSPASQVTGGAPPALLIHGEADTVVPIAWSERFATAMQAAGNEVQFERLPETGHAFIIPGYGRNPTIDHAMNLTDGFLRRLGYLPTETTP